MAFQNETFGDYSEETQTNKEKYEKMVDNIESSSNGGRPSQEQMAESRKLYEDVKVEEKKRMAEVGMRIKEKYLIEEHDGYNVGLKELYETEQLGELDDVQLEKVGISVDKRGRFRIKDPDKPELMGSYVEQEVLKALLLGLRDAKNEDEQWAVIEDTYDYLGLDSPEKPTKEEIKQAHGFIPAITQKIGRSPLARVAMLTAVLGLAGLMLSRESGQQVDNTTKYSSIEKGNQDHVYKLTEADNMGIGSVARRLLIEAGVDSPTDEQIWEVIKPLARDNNVAVPELGVEGDNDDEKLPVGFQVDTKSGADKAVEIAQQLV